jgi:DSF synthase
VERTSFTPSLLRDVRRLQQSIEDRFTYYTELGQQPFKYLVWASHHPTIFNLGGDLSLFADLIQSGDRDRLKRYAKACIDICYPNAVNHHLPIITVTLAQGDTLGGGFESALSSDIIIAESSAKFGLPEILFGLFPGMGAFSFLSRKLGSAKAERIIKSGKIYTAEELHEIGLVEVVCEDGMGQEAVREYVTANAHRHNAHQAIYRVRQASNPVSYQEMSAIIDIWVDTAMNLDESDLRRMHRLAAAQERRRLRQSTSREAER